MVYYDHEEQEEAEPDRRGHDPPPRHHDHPHERPPSASSEGRPDGEEVGRLTATSCIARAKKDTFDERLPLTEICSADSPPR